MADSFTRGILMKDLKAMQKSPLPFAWVPDDVLIDDNILTWQLWLVGPEGTLLCVTTPRHARARPRGPRARRESNNTSLSGLGQGFAQKNYTTQAPHF